LLENISLVQSKIGTNSDSVFQIMCREKEYSFKTSNPTLKFVFCLNLCEAVVKKINIVLFFLLRNEWIKQLQKAIEIYKQKKRSMTQSLSACNSNNCLNLSSLKLIFLFCFKFQYLKETR
jgi:hypothetical protein